ncbi:MAG: hypothetical protein R3D69_05155 [Xanthobacteraceae bacterium]
MLSVELGELSVLLPEASIEIEATGFSISEFDQIISDPNVPTIDAADELPEPGPAVTRLGDVWICNRSRVLCADALLPKSYEILMDGHLATMTFCDPPYNVSIRKPVVVENKVGAGGNDRHRRSRQGPGRRLHARARDQLPARHECRTAQRPPFDVDKDLAMVALLTRTPLVAIASSQGRRASRS